MIPRLLLRGRRFADRDVARLLRRGGDLMRATESTVVDGR